MCVNKLGHLVTSFFSDSLTDVVAVARGVYGRYLRGGCGAGWGIEGCICEVRDSILPGICSGCVSTESPCNDRSTGVLTPPQA